MPITINFSTPINESVQIGDTAYHATISEVATFDTSSSYVEIGPITSITQWNGTASAIVCDTTAAYAAGNDPAAAGSFILFSKSSEVNQAKVKGYYASVKFQNQGVANTRTELYSAAAEIFTSSGHPAE
jgi:hypothetical protein